MLFSIIVPVYNVEKYLRQCIDSVLAQTYQNFELVLVNDGSQDGCGQIIDAYAANDSRIVTVHKSNGGLVSARKAGLDVASGEYIVILDGDDWIAENTLACVAKAIHNYHADMVCYGHFVASEQSAREVAITQKEMIYNKQDIEKNILPTLLLGSKKSGLTTTLWGKAFKRELYKTFQQLVDNRIAMGEDGAVVYPCVCQAESICFLPDCLYFYRSNPTSMTRSRKKLIPWEGALLRIEHLRNCLPLEKYNMRKQQGCYTAHAVFNVILTQLANRDYAEVKEEALEKLASGDLMELIRNAEYSGSFQEKMAQFALRCRWIWLIKLYAVIR